jgi:hypothetical protein
MQRTGISFLGRHIFLCDFVFFFLSRTASHGRCIQPLLDFTLIRGGAVNFLVVVFLILSERGLNNGPLL